MLKYLVLFASLLAASTYAHGCGTPLSEVFEDVKSLSRTMNRAVRTEDEAVIRDTMAAMIAKFEEAKQYAPQQLDPENDTDEVAAFHEGLQKAQDIIATMDAPDARAQALADLRAHTKESHQAFKRCE